MMRQWLSALVAIELLGLAGCASSRVSPLAAGGALRVERIGAAAAPQQFARAEGRVQVRSHTSAGSLTLDAAPTFFVPLDGVSAARQIVRTELRVAAPERRRLQADVRLNAERGQTRAVDVATEALDPRPLATTLATERLGAEVGVGFRASRRSAFALRLVTSRTGGTGSDAGVLPSLTQSTAAIERRVMRGSQRGLTWQLAGESVLRASDAPWRAVRLDAAWSAPWGRRQRVQVGVGVLRGLDSAGTAPRLAMAWQYRAPAGEWAWDASVAQVPELDRLDGSVRARRRARLSLESTRVSRVSFRGTLHALADADGPSPRRGVGSELTLRQALGTTATLEAELARVLLWEGRGPSRSESRFTVGVRLPLR